MIKYLVYSFCFLGLNNLALANRNPLNDIEGSGPSLGIFFLFFLLPILFWLLGLLINAHEKSKKQLDIDKQKKYRQHFDIYIKEWATANKEKELKDYLDSHLDCKSCGKKIPKVAKYQQWMVCHHCKCTFRNPEWDMPQRPTLKLNQTNISNTGSTPRLALNDKFPELTEEELQEANWILNGTKSTKCPCCNHKDLVSNFLFSSAGNTYRKCNVCGTHFQFSKSMIELQQTIYRRCPACRNVVKINEVCPCQI